MKKNIKIFAVFASIALLGTPAIAAEIEMICKNPRREYLVKFDAVKRTFRVRTVGIGTAYTVKQIERGEHGTIVRGMTPNNGPGFTAYFGGKKRIEFRDAGKIVQTDLCK